MFTNTSTDRLLLTYTIYIPAGITMLHMLRFYTSRNCPLKPVYLTKKNQCLKFKHPVLRENNMIILLNINDLCNSI